MDVDEEEIRSSVTWQKYYGQVGGNLKLKNNG